MKNEIHLSDYIIDSVCEAYQKQIGGDKRVFFNNYKWQYWDDSNNLVFIRDAAKAESRLFYFWRDTLD